MRISDWSSDVCSSDLKVPRDPLNGLVEDVFAAVDAAVAAGYVDPDRLAVQGQSYGGYTAAALVGLTDRFKAAVAQAGPYNLLSLYGTFDERSRIHDAEKGLQLFAVSLLEPSQGGLGAPPWDDPESYQIGRAARRERVFPYVKIRG